MAIPLRRTPARFALLALSLAMTVAALAGSLTSPASASVRPPVGGTLVGADIGWPNCPKGMGIPQRPTEGQPMPTAQARFVVLGLTNGPAFTPNPCLAAQVAWARARHLWTGAYSVTSFPTAAQLRRWGGSGTALQRLRRVGVAQARTNLAVMHRAGLRAPFVWVDVEPVPGWPWSASRAANNAVVDGVLAGYRAAGVGVGLYTYGAGWREITGGRQLPSLPTWLPSGRDTLAAAAARCRATSPSGGPVWLGQSTASSRDVNVTCPGVTGTAAGPHPLTQYLGVRLAVGSRGAAVTAVQRRLGAAADGVFGAQTAARVARFQASRGLAATGVVDQGVWRALGAGTRVPARPSKLPGLFVST